MTKVHCTVNDCEYHVDAANLCRANEILIAGKPFPLEVNHHGKDVPQDYHTPVDRKDGTFCYTFECEG